ncbi:hypothetical protein [Primorskyibacter sp. 2E233]|uniref:hypothetical protein n=1 Tax=Primorskyibacter sp. 2E233 TaxID=3413431 RepID=UPI003BEFF664
MSDPVTNMEIEDVLSSIRRLVSEDTRPKRPHESPAQADRLVLTPALRVKQDDRDESVEIEETPKQSAPSAEVPVLLTNPTNLPKRKSILPERKARSDGAETKLVGSEDAVQDALETALADLADAPALPVASDEIVDTIEFRSTPAPDEQEPSDTLQLQDLLDADAGDLADSLEDSDEVSQSDDDLEDDDFESDTPLTASSILSQLVEQEVARAFSEGAAIESREVEVESLRIDAAPADARDEVETGTSMDEGDSGDLEDLLAEDLTQTKPEASVTDVSAEALAGAIQSDKAEAAEEPVSEETPARSLESKIAALEEMVAHQSGEWDGDTVEEAAFVHRPSAPLEWEDHHTPAADVKIAQPKAAGIENAVQAPVEAEAEAEAEALPTIDDEMLRQMVSEIVRQELQGALGERITRNVRKLVRREIHRAMISQDFD